MNADFGPTLLTGAQAVYAECVHQGGRMVKIAQRQLAQRREKLDRQNDITDDWQFIVPLAADAVRKIDHAPAPPRYPRPIEPGSGFADRDCYAALPMSEREHIERESRRPVGWVDDRQLAMFVDGTHPLRDLRRRYALLKEAAPNGVAITALARSNIDDNEWLQIFAKSSSDSEARFFLALRAKDDYRRNLLFAEADSRSPALSGLARTTTSNDEFRRIVKRAAELSRALEYLVEQARSDAHLQIIMEHTPVHAIAYRAAAAKRAYLRHNDLFAC